MVYATDNEPGDPKLDESLRELAAGADILINDAQFTPEQLATTRNGWGHSSWKEGVKLAREVGAKTLVLFHHDPDSTDRMVDSILRQAREEFDSVFAASEGMVITLGARATPCRRTCRGRARLAARAQFRASYRSDRRRKRVSGRDGGAGYFFARGADFAAEHAAAAIGIASDDGDARRGWFAVVDEIEGYVVRIDAGEEKGQSAVGVVFTD